MEQGAAVLRESGDLVFTFGASGNFFEDIAKFRAARRVWDSLERGAAEFCVRTSGGSFTNEDLIRETFEVLAAVLGGAESVDGETAERILRVIEFESGITLVPDALGGSYYVEELTADMESAIRTAL